MRAEWRRLIECLESQIVFRKRATNCRALWRKMIYKDKASYDSTQPCIITNERCHVQLSAYVCVCLREGDRMREMKERKRESERERRRNVCGKIICMEYI